MGPQERDPRLAPLLIRQLLSIEDCGCDKARCAGLHARDHVGVLLHGERWRLMAQAFTDHLHRYPRLECDRGMSVSKVMQPASASAARSGVSRPSTPLAHLALGPAIVGLATRTAHDLVQEQERL